ncbi:MAG: hypothetical protein DA405_07655 [Bacteroidetes bacterium]|nr:MAG: hypothetical protein DA405_07655 [Bacteroidota bacterium]
MHFKSFFQQFFIPELRSFLVKLGMILGVISIMFLSLWSIGFSEGTSRFLKERMDSPFIKFLSVNLPGSIENRPNYQGELREEFSNEELLKSFGIKETHFVPTGRINFQDLGGGVMRTRVRPIDPETHLYRFLFRENKDLILTKEKLIRMEDSEWSAVVSKDLLISLGYDIDNPPLYINHVPYYRNEKPVVVPILIAGIADKLPDKMGAFFTEKAFYAITNRFEYSPFDDLLPQYQNNVSAFIGTSKSEKEIRNLLEGCLGDKKFDLEIDKGVYTAGYKVQVEFFDENEKPAIVSAMANCFSSDEYRYFTYLPFDRVNRGELRINNNDYFVLEFNQLDSVPRLANYLQVEYDLAVNLNDVESAKNFSVFNKISSFLSVILTLFTITIIIYIISKTIVEHIDRNKASLGTLKAFGLSNYTITLVYSGVAMIIVTAVFVTGFLFAFLLGEFINEYLITNGLNLDDPTETLFALELKLLYIFSFMLLPVIIIWILVYRKLKGTTPGDLIYGR